MKNNKGITLIALVITIIVLLILASVGIAMLTGENGLLNKVTAAKEKHNEEQAREKIILAVNNLSAQIVPDENRSIVLDDIIRIENEEIEVNKNEDGTIIKYTDEESKEYVVATVDGYSFKVYADGRVEKIETQEILSIEYEVKQVLSDEEAKLLITFKSTTGIQKIIPPDVENTIQGNGETKISIDYTVRAGEEYKFKVIGTKETQVEKVIIWDPYQANISITEGLIAYYPLIENTRNYVRNSEPGNLVNCYSGGSAVTFPDGVRLVSADVSLLSENQCTLPYEYTMVCEMKFDEFPNDSLNAIMSYANSGRESAASNSLLVYKSNNGLRVYNGQSGSGTDMQTEINTDTWYRFIMTGNSEEIKIYKDNNLIATTPGVVYYDWPRKIGLGNAHGGEIWSLASTTGFAKHFAIYNRVLSQEEINSLQFE